MHVEENYYGILKSFLFAFRDFVWTDKDPTQSIHSFIRSLRNAVSASDNSQIFDLIP